MATRSTISKLNSDGSVETIYCHFDGNIDHNGKLLKNNYNTQEKVNELIALGSLSSLGKNIKPTLKNHSYETPEKDVCVAYHRDRKEDLNISKFNSINEYMLVQNHIFEKYNYIWMSGEWFLVNNKNKTFKIFNA